MKILFVGDYSGLHATLARSLRRMGHECLVLGDGSKCMDTTRDIDLTRRPGLLGGLAFLSRVFSLWSSLKGYDVVQLINPNFMHLRPGKLRYFLRELKASNRLLSLSLAGTDPVYAKACMEDGLFRYSEFKIGKEKSPYWLETPGLAYRWLNGGMGDYCRFVYENVDCALSALYEYHAASAKYLGADKLSYTGIPVDTEEIGFAPLPMEGGRLNMLVGIKSEMQTMKGTDRLLAAARRVEAAHPDRCKVTVAQDLPFTMYMEKMRAADVVLDQMYSYTPATNALQAMAMGKIAVSGAEPEYYDFIGERENRPIVNALPDDDALFSTLEALVLSPRSSLEQQGRRSRAFVETHNSATRVATRAIEAWQRHGSKYR